MPQTLQQALQSFNRAKTAELDAEVETIRQTIVNRFPLESWGDMPLERYALGQQDHPDSFCRWMEFKSTELGSISGGSSAKTIIYKHRDKPGWHFPPSFPDEQQAWFALRESVATMLTRARAGEWDVLQDLLPFQYGPALWLKTLHVYFPSEILPVYSTAHLARFRYRLRNIYHRTSTKLGPVALNRRLLSELRDTPELDGFGNHELARFLYHWDDPREASSVYKIAPGEDAKLWPQCLAGGYVAVGWPVVGDLSAFESFPEFEARFRGEYLSHYGDTLAGKATVTRKAKELWLLMKMEPGDLVLANRGMSQILAVGTVQDPPYEWAEDGGAYPHRIRVTWDTAQARPIPPQSRWAFVTVAPVSIELYEQLMSGQPSTPHPVAPIRLPPVDKTLVQLGERLEERKQLILYGPPGTGKTFTAGGSSSIGC
ncbi:MAG: hypothetical protein AB7U83_19945 [Vicinamibacterales bacterium]